MIPKSVLSLALSALGVLAASTALFAQTDPTPATATRLIPLEEYRDNLSKADSSVYLRRPEVRVKQQTDFEEMRQHLITLYEPLKITHSFELETDVYDCIPIDQQPSVRLQHIVHVAEAPPITLPSSAKTTKVRTLRTPKVEEYRPALQAKQVGEAIDKDRFGNASRCEANTIPMRRVTLDEITRFPTLRDFLRKSTDETGPLKVGMNIMPCAGPKCLHKYSVVNQTVSNWGGNSTINVWSPRINTYAGEDFSLTQHWYVGGAGTMLPGLQTVEVGWQNYPKKYGDQRSRLFIYHTADGYKTTGCYNLDCGDFVQTNGRVYLGGGFTDYSTTGGPQWEMTTQVQFYKGNWWIFYQGTAFGYYPGALFHDGQLTQHASNAQYGTESAGVNLWPQEGSGAWPSTGWGKAAYQKNLFYINTSRMGIWESLSAWNVAPCYTLNGPSSSSDAGWEVYFYDGGPGGSGC